MFVSESRDKVEGGQEIQGHMSQTSDHSFPLRTLCTDCIGATSQRQLSLLTTEPCAPAGRLPVTHSEHGSSPSNLWSPLFGSKLLHLNFRSKVFFVAVGEFKSIQKVTRPWLFKKINWRHIDIEGVSAMVHFSTEPMEFYMDRGWGDGFLPRCQNKSLYFLNDEFACLITPFRVLSQSR